MIVIKTQAELDKIQNIEKKTLSEMGIKVNNALAKMTPSQRENILKMSESEDINIDEMLTDSNERISELKTKINYLTSDNTLLLNKKQFVGGVVKELITLKISEDNTKIIEVNIGNYLESISENGVSKYVNVLISEQDIKDIRNFCNFMTGNSERVFKIKDFDKNLSCFVVDNFDVQDTIEKLTVANISHSLLETTKEILPALKEIKEYENYIKQSSEVEQVKVLSFPELYLMYLEGDVRLDMETKKMRYKKGINSCYVLDTTVKALFDLVENNK